MSSKGTENIDARLTVTKELAGKGVVVFSDDLAQQPTLYAFDLVCAELLRERKATKKIQAQLTKMKRWRIVLAVCLLLAAVGCGVLAVNGDLLTMQYVGSTSSDKYHKPSCEYADKIYDGYLVHYASAEAAEHDGRVPCALCLGRK